MAESPVVAAKTWGVPLASMGHLALTVYIGHVIVGLGTVEEMGRLEGLSLPFAISASVASAYVSHTRFSREPLQL